MNKFVDLLGWMNFLTDSEQYNPRACNLDAIQTVLVRLHGKYLRISFPDKMMLKHAFHTGSNIYFCLFFVNFVMIWNSGARYSIWTFHQGPGLKFGPKKTTEHRSLGPLIADGGKGGDGPMATRTHREKIAV